ncbi:MAG: phosphatase PAP2 family protein [Ginsengibacter sp.]
MKFDPRLIITGGAFFFLSTLQAQMQQPALSNDTIPGKINRQPEVHHKHLLSPLLLPAMGIVYGFSGLHSDAIKDINEELQEEVFIEHKHKQLHIDNYLQFSPGVAVYALNALGIKGEHSFADRSGIYLLSNVLLNVSCQSIKKASHSQRPDASTYASFPSGHTAEAFASAEFLRQEYKNVSPWYGVAGYAAAVSTGYLRMYNNRHWFSDVMAGAGIGILSTKFSYWLYPKLKNTLFKNHKEHALVMPSYNNGNIGLGLIKTF